MFYDRKIKYLDYLENGERVRGSGFVKLEAKDRSLRMDVTVTGLHPTDTFVRDVMLRTEKGENLVGRIEISAGKGKYQHICRDLENLCGMGIGYGELLGLRIPLGADREISCNWREKREVNTGNAGISRIGTAGQDKKSEDIGEKDKADAIRLEAKIQPEDRAEPQLQEEKAHMEETADRAKNALNRGIKDEENVMRRTKQNDIAIQKEQIVNEPQALPIQELKIQDKEPNQEKKKEHKMPVNLLEDKWSQLCAIYPHIRPFHDEREYLSIGPADFVLFPSNSYKMANNSFLLHGYYNYNHLILVRVEKKGDILYYIGVPGNFFEKEKQVAIMFGFESFECAEEPAQAGDFGYYMMRTEL